MASDKKKYTKMIDIYLNLEYFFVKLLAVSWKTRWQANRVLTQRGLLRARNFVPVVFHWVTVASLTKMKTKKTFFFLGKPNCYLRVLFQSDFDPILLIRNVIFNNRMLNWINTFLLRIDNSKFNNLIQIHAITVCRLHTTFYIMVYIYRFGFTMCTSLG